MALPNSFLRCATHSLLRDVVQTIGVCGAPGEYAAPVVKLMRSSPRGHFLRHIQSWGLTLRGNFYLPATFVVRPLLLRLKHTSRQCRCYLGWRTAPALATDTPRTSSHHLRDTSERTDPCSTNYCAHNSSPRSSRMTLHIDDIAS